MSKNFSNQDIIMFEHPLPVVIQKIIELYACEHPLVSVIKSGYVFIVDSLYYQISNKTRFYWDYYSDDVYEFGMDNDIQTESYYEPPYEDLLLLRNTKKSVFLPLNYSVYKNNKIHKNRYSINNFTPMFSKLLYEKIFCN